MFGIGRKRAAPAAALYDAAVELARDPAWYAAGGVPDTVDGRFDALATVLSLIVLRLQRDGLGQAEADLADRFAYDMDGNLRRIGVSDLAISKHVGRAVGALAGRVGAYRAALGDDGALGAALARNLYRGEPVEPRALDWAVRHARALEARIAARAPAELAAGRL